LSPIKIKEKKQPAINEKFKKVKRHKLDTIKIKREMPIETIRIFDFHRGFNENISKT
jgi:hypothetical protein